MDSHLSIQNNTWLRKYSGSTIGLLILRKMNKMNLSKSSYTKTHRKLMHLREIEAFARILCSKDEEDPWLYEHVQLVREYAVELVKIENADIEVCEMAALLHDIGKCKRRKNHHITGRNLADKFLESMDIPEEKKKLILKCILKHRSRFSSEDNEIEVKVIQSADCLGALFNERWQEHCRTTLPEEKLMEFYTVDALKRINLESARKIARPQLEILKEKLKNGSESKN